MSSENVDFDSHNELENFNKSLRKKAEEIADNKKCSLLNCTNLMLPKETKSLVHELQVHQIELEMQNDELIKVQHELHDSQKSYFNLYNMAPVGYCTISKEGLILNANLTALTLLGETRDKLIHKPVSNFILKEDQDIYYLCRKKLHEINHESTCELRMKHTNGTYIWAHLSVALTKSNETPYFMLVISDITENKKAQEEIVKLNANLKNEVAMQLKELRKKDTLLMQQSTMAQLGEMINMIAHQWRQPLNAISGASVQLSLLNMMGNLTKEVIDKNTKFTQDVVQRMSQIIDDFMNFSRKIDDTAFSLIDAVNKTYEIIEAQFQDRGIEVKIEVDESLEIFHNKRAIEHSLLNILINSRDAFEEHPEIQKREIRIYTKENDDAILLALEDNAGGIAKDIIAKIFNPYFTTKTEKKGTGLGLYMTKQMIEKIENCTISVESQNGKTAFIIKLHKV